jgi:hypothetical protein
MKFIRIQRNVNTGEITIDRLDSGAEDLGQTINGIVADNLADDGCRRFEVNKNFTPVSPEVADSRPSADSAFSDGTITPVYSNTYEQANGSATEVIEVKIFVEEEVAA